MIRPFGARTGGGTPWTRMSSRCHGNSLSPKSAAAAGHPPAPRQHRTRAVLAPPGLVGAAAGGDRPAAHGTGLAAVPARVHPLPAVTRCASAECPPDDGVVRCVSVPRRTPAGAVVRCPGGDKPRAVSRLAVCLLTPPHVIRKRLQRERPQGHL